MLLPLAAIYLFTSGFLLKRLALTNVSPSSSSSSLYEGIPPTHKRAIVLIIDALRFDFLSPNPPSPPSPFHHGVLTLPAELTEKYPERSLLFDAYVDPPTTTLQRIKALTTGSLPTFVDIGSNFAGGEVGEDSIVKQLKRAGKKVAFTGDDTWLSVFPKTFEENMTFPFDSFNVEDLHTVDNGVVSHLFPLLSPSSSSQDLEFDFLIGHFLGVDHVGHRVGPDHPSMHAKLTQMNDVLKRVVDLLPADTLLVVLGDHGMDASGDHGGDGTLETSAAVWMYSSGASLRHSPPSPSSGSPNSVLSKGGVGKIPGGLLEYATFPEATKAFRRIQQIDLVPTLSLLLGLPIPFNNLGSIIPELFFRPSPSRSSPHPHSNLKDVVLEKALRKNAEQIMTYLETYRASASGGELDESWKDLVELYKLIRSEEFKGRKEESRLVGLMNFNRFALGVCRRMWAQFDAGLMGMGLVLLGMTLCESWGMYSGLKAFAHGKGRGGGSWKVWARQRVQWMGAAGLLGGLLGAFASRVVGYGWIHLSIFGGTLLASMAGIIHSPPSLLSPSSMSFKTITPIIILLVHSLCFFSNSFTFWEDRIVSFLSISSIVPYTLTAFTSPILRLRKRILGFSLLYALCVRLIGWSSVCREEQQPWCDVTFYSHSSGSAAPSLAVYLSIPSVFLLAYGVKRVLGTTKSEGGIAGFTKGYVVVPAMVAGTVGWLLEYYSLLGGEGVGLGGGGWEPLVRVWRTWLARGSFSLLLLLGIPLWFMHPVSLTIQLSDRPQDQKENGGGKGAKKQVTVLGYANAFGSPLFAFWFLWVGVVWVCTQLMGQLVLVLGCVALMSWLEVLDGVKDSEAVEKAFSVGRPPLPSSSTKGENGSGKGINSVEEEDFSPPFTFGWTLPLCLLGLQMFFGTGHQGTISSIQWKSAFLVSGEVVYPWSVLTVLINSVGMVGVFAGLASGLVVVWCVVPRNEERKGSSSSTSTTTTTTTPTTTTNGSTTKETTETQTLPTPLLLLPSLSVHIYFHTLLLASSTASAILRRHLMVWKVFAPRFMLGVVLMGVVDLGALVGLVGVWRVRRVVRGVLRGMR